MAVIRRIGTPENASESRAIKRIEGQGSMHDPDGAVEVIARMCAPEIGDRYKSLPEVLEDLEIVDA